MELALIENYTSLSLIAFNEYVKILKYKHPSVIQYSLRDKTFYVFEFSGRRGLIHLC